MRAKMNTILAVLSFLFLIPAYVVSGDRPEQEIINKLELYSSSVQPQKVYLHLDKTSYQAGQTIWFKAYVFDGLTNTPELSETNLYAELINSDGKAMAMKVMLADGGYALGDMKLDTNLPDGNYVLRAYTNWMRNSGEEYYFKRYLYIRNPRYENMIPRMDVFRNRLFNRKIGRLERNYEVAFFPEGGNLLAGVKNRVAFKVVDQLGKGQHAGGEILNSSGEIVASFSTELEGIGVFYIDPLPGEIYTARISVGDGRESSYDFPEVMNTGYAMHIDSGEDVIRVNVEARPGNVNNSGEEEIIIVAHSGGIPYYAEVYLLQDNTKEVVLNNDKFPSGITHFTLFTRDYKPVAERLVFTGTGDELSITPRISNRGKAGPEYYELSFDVADQQGNPVEGIFSLSAVTGEPDEDVHKMDILSYILLDSELKGMIGNPSLYIEALDENPQLADHLLLTYGWRRFEWDDVLAGEIPDMSHSGQPGLTVAGRLIDPAKNESLNNYPVQLKITNDDGDLFKTNTSRNGAFAFSDLFYRGVINMELSSRRLPANYPPVFELNVSGGTGYDYEPGIFTKKQQVTGRGEDWSRVRGVSDSPYSSAPERDAAPQLYGVPDQTIFIDYETSTERNLYDILRNRAVGLNFEGGRVTIRGPSSLFGPTEARFMIDGIFVDRQAFLNLYPREVERIEIFRGTSAAIFGIRGGTGVILAYTRKPSYRGFEDVLELSMLGYHEPGEFYSDVILTQWSAYDPDAERTIYWEPELVSGPDGIMNVRLPLKQGADRLRFTVEGAGLDGGLGFMQFTLDID